MESFRLNGIWWLPGEDQRTVAGELKFDSEDGAKLHILGRITPNGSEDIERFSVESDDSSGPVETIHGMSEEGTLLTLSRSWELGVQVSMPGMQRSTLKPEIVVRGDHIGALSSVVFQGGDVSFAHLADWLGFSGLRHEWRQVPGSNNGTTIHLHYDGTPPSKIKVADRFTVQVGFDFLLETPTTGMTTAKETPFFYLEFYEPVAFDVLVNTYFRRLQLFLALALGEPTPVAHERAVLAPVGGRDPAGSVENDDVTRPRQVQLSYSSVGSRAPRRHTRGSIPDQEMLFRYSDVQHDLGGFLTRWFHCADSMRAVVDLYAAARLGAGTFLEHQLLCYAQALEVYHRSGDSERFLDKRTFASVRRLLEDAIPPELTPEAKDAFKKKLAYLNEHTLLERLLAILERETSALADYVPDVPSLARQIRDARNYYTHHFDQDRRKVPEGKELYLLVLRMRLILETCLLRQLGFETGKIRELLRRNVRYRELRTSRGAPASLT